MGLSEFQLIDRIFARRARRREDVILGIGDDAALLRPPPGSEVAAAIDGMHAGIHFPQGTEPRAFGHKILAVNLSDLAAMGAEPAWATLFLSLPEADESYAAAFAEGFFALAERHGVALVGGDTVRGPLAAVVQAEGFVPAGRALRRDGAAPGDAIFVTNTLGDGGGGLAVAEGTLPADGPGLRLRQRLDFPLPRVGAGMALRGIASAAIDISDGLLPDLGHILERSGCGASLDTTAIPLSDALVAAVGRERAVELALTGGDDYELCFTVPGGSLAGLPGELEPGCRITRIGTVEAEAGLRLHGADGRRQATRAGGYDHFGSR